MQKWLFDMVNELQFLHHHLKCHFREVSFVGPLLARQRATANLPVFL
jgi:hypothetical protein